MKRGSTVAIITPMKETGEIDFVGLKTLLQYHLDSGTANLCILGTTGEASTMTRDERAAVLKTAVEMVKGSIPILAGTGTINPTAVKEMTLQAIDLGCDASLVVTPYYVKPPQRALIKHMTDAADIGLPVIMYNVPGRTGCNFLDESMAIAAEHPNIVGVKDATGDLSRVETMRKLTGPDFLLYSGDDATSVDFLLKGGDGCISVTANVAALAMQRMVKAALEGDEETARGVNDSLELLHKNLFVESNPIPTKYAAKKLGMIESSFARPPLCTLDPALEYKVDEALQSAGLLSS